MFLAQPWDWLTWCQFTGTIQDSKFDLQLLSLRDSTYSGLCRSVVELPFACCGDIEQPRKK